MPRATSPRWPGTLLVLALMAWPTPRAHAAGAAAGGAYPLLEDLGNWRRKITTRSPQAQRYFDQGLQLAYAFDREAAQRSFEEAARLDPDCAMCYWGAAYALGRDINVPPIPERTAAAYEAIHKALARQAHATPVERALMDAMARRYASPQPADPAEQVKLETAYADAMRELAKRFPDDADVQALFAESLMDLHPWDYWTADGKPQPGTPEILATLEAALQRWPDHPLANHLHIHALEASPTPERALPSARRLPRSTPGAGHLVHMPAHILHRVGRYEESTEANRRAVEADDAYAAKLGTKGFIGMYMAHNHHFQCYSAMMQGRSAESIAAARKAAAGASLEMLQAMPGFDYFLAAPMFAMARFGRWDDILKEPAPVSGFAFEKAIWRYGRGLALAARGRLEEAGAEADSLAGTAQGIPAEAMEGFNPTRALLAIAGDMLAGEIAAKQGRRDEAIERLRSAVEGEDALRYDEPSDWFYPTRHSLGAVLLQAGRAREAEAVYREDLKRNPGNGWALFGLARSLRAQRKDAAAAKVEAQFRRAWKDADVTLMASAF